jgi:hypothetical protein
LCRYTVEHDGSDEGDGDSAVSGSDGNNSGGGGGAETTDSTKSSIKQKRGVEWLVLMDPGTRLLAPVTRPPTADANGADDQHWWGIPCKLNPV